jgi:two-component system sensor histidine kinase CreC
VSISARVSLAFALLCSLGFYFFVGQVLEATKQHYREATEEPLIDLATILAAQVAEHAASHGGKVQSAAPTLALAFRRAYGERFAAQIFALKKQRVDVRVYLTDARGRVVFDSAGRAVGRYYAAWNDVWRTLQGAYGARMTHGDPWSKAGMMYVAAPVRSHGAIIGVLSVGKPTHSSDSFIRLAKRSTVLLGVLSAVTVVLLATLLTFLVASPLRRLTGYVRALRDGRRVVPPVLRGRELHELRLAFDEMREAAEGRRYLERYVQTLTHELKSPLAGIRGAVELLREGLPPAEQARFLGYVEADAARIQTLSEKLLALATLQRQDRFSDKQPCAVGPLVEELSETLGGSLRARSLSLTLEGDLALTVRAQPFWLREALLHLLQNAVDFSPPEAPIALRWALEGSQCVFRVVDAGPGIPEWARARVFEPFFSLPRPDTKRRSSGLGLELVKEIAELHGGAVKLDQAPGGGVEAVLALPA